LLKETSNGDPRRLAGEILSAVQRLYTTLSHLLSFAGEPTLAGDTLAVPALMRDLLEDCLPLFEDPSWSITYGIQPKLPPIWGDRGLLVQALVNLIVNAKESMPEGGCVQLTVHLSPLSTLNGRIHRAVEIKVSDGGCGIPPENRERVFDPFFTTKCQGTGLGLAFSHKIISAHRGSIEIAPAAGGGSELTVRLPAAEEI
jgi:signal transduction histidine kinase